MRFRDLFAEAGRTLSFEFFPPKTEDGLADFMASLDSFEALAPSFVSVTYGAAGTSGERTRGLVDAIASRVAMPVVPHLTCCCHTRAEIEALLEGYAQSGIRNIVALRGDRPADWNGQAGEYRYATELVEHIADFGSRTGHAFGIAVAGYPEGHPAANDRLLEIEHLKAKVDAGADCVITQLFFDNRDFEDFRDRCELAGISVPIVAGIMPVTSVSGMKRMAQLAGRARFPAALLRGLNRAEDDADAIRRVGVHWATEQCRDLLDRGVDGIHFYTLNRSKATREIYASLGVRDSRRLLVRSA